MKNEKILELQEAFKKICPKIPGFFSQLMIAPWNLEALESELVQDILDEKVKLNYKKQIVNISDEKVRKCFNGKWVNEADLLASKKIIHK